MQGERLCARSSWPPGSRSAAVKNRLLTGRVCGSVHDFMTWAFQSAREYGLQTCASFESTSKAFRTRKGIAERVRWEPYVDPR